MSVVSLFPSATEVAAAVGATPAAVSHQCDYPPAVVDRPTLTGLVRELDADPAELDRIAAYDDVYYLDGDILEAADPDVILTQGVCAVCALDASLAHEAVEQLDLDCTVLDVHAEDLGDVLKNIERIGAAVGREESAMELRTELEARIDEVRKAVDAIPDADRPRVAAFDWTEPLRHGGLWVPELLEIAGGEVGLAAAGERSGKVEWDEVRAFNPERIVVAPCGYDVAGAERALEDLFDREGYADLAAVRDGHVYAMDGAAYMNRHSHRVVDTLEAFAAILHPDIFDSDSERVSRVQRSHSYGPVE